MNENQLNNKMETRELEPITEPIERILIFENLQEIQKIRQEIENRVSLLNQIAAHRLSADQIRTITTSKATIDDFIFREQLKINNELRKQFEAGKKNLLNEYELPKNLQDLKYSLLAWHSYSAPGGRSGDKFQFLTFADQWQIDEKTLEDYFVRQKYKVYINLAEDIKEYAMLVSFCEYFEQHRMESGQLVATKFLTDRIQPAGRHKFIPNYRYFLRENKNWS